MSERAKLVRYVVLRLVMAMAAVVVLGGGAIGILSLIPAASTIAIDCGPEPTMEVYVVEEIEALGGEAPGTWVLKFLNHGQKRFLVHRSSEVDLYGLIPGQHVKAVFRRGDSEGDPAPVCDLKLPTPAQSAAVDPLTQG